MPLIKIGRLILKSAQKLLWVIGFLVKFTI